MKHRIRGVCALCLTATVALSLSACTTINPPKAGRVTREAHHAKSQHQPKAATHPVLAIHHTPWLVNPRPVQRPHANKRSAIADTPVTLETNQPLTLSDVAERIGEAAGVRVVVSNLTLGEARHRAGGTNSAQSHESTPVSRSPSRTSSTTMRPMRVFFSGPLSKLLNAVSAHFRVHWRIQNGSVRLFRFTTHAYNVGMSVLSKQVNSSISTNASGEASSGSNGQARTGTTLSGGTIKVKSKASVTPLHDVVAGVQNVLRQAGEFTGRVVATPSLGQIVVTATPEGQSAVAQYLKAVNEALGRDVMIGVRVYQVTVNQTLANSFALNTMFKNLQNTLKASVTGIAAPALKSSVAPSSLSLVVPARVTEQQGKTLAHLAGSQAVVHALTQAGRVELVTSGAIVTSNGVPSPMQIANQISYLERTATTATTNAGTTSTLTPGTLTVGFTGNFLPRLTGRRRIMLQYQFNLSTLVSINTVKSGGQEIQTPNVSQQSFDQTMTLKNGQTLVLAGFGQRSRNLKKGYGLLSGFHQHDGSHTFLVILMHVAEVQP